MPCWWGLEEYTQKAETSSSQLSFFGLMTKKPGKKGFHQQLFFCAIRAMLKCALFWLPQKAKLFGTSKPVGLLGCQKTGGKKPGKNRLFYFYQWFFGVLNAWRSIGMLELQKPTGWGYSSSAIEFALSKRPNAAKEEILGYFFRFNPGILAENARLHAGSHQTDKEIKWFQKKVVFRS